MYHKHNTTSAVKDSQSGHYVVQWFGEGDSSDAVTFYVDVEPHEWPL